jgi:hypothetical protein
MSIKNRFSQVNHATFFNKIYKHYIHNTNIALITFRGDRNPGRVIVKGKNFGKKRF